MRREIDRYIKNHVSFLDSLEPVEAAPGAPGVIADMCGAAKAAGVGPMAAVAGAFSAFVGRSLFERSKQVIVENGGDLFIKTQEQRTVAIYAGDSPLSMKMGIAVAAAERPIAVCTSSGTVGPSLSFGKADAAVVVSYDACLADACATRLGNEIKSETDLQRALEVICEISGVIGAMAVIGDKCGAVGDIDLVCL